MALKTMFRKAVKEPVQKAARTITRDPRLEMLARFGYAASGILHGLIGFAAITITFGSHQEADQSGVLGPLTQSVLGRVLVLAIFAGLVSLAVWKIAEVSIMRKSKQAKKRFFRLEELSKAIVYLVLALTSVAFLFNHSSASASITTSQQITLDLLRMPLGIPLLYLLGVVLIATGLNFIYRGIRRRFLDALEDEPPVVLDLPVKIFGIVGYIAKGVVFMVLGGLFFNAAYTFNPSEASGLDGAFRSFIALPFGAVLLALVGVGFLMYAAYSIARARLAEM